MKRKIIIIIILTLVLIVENIMYFNPDLINNLKNKSQSNSEAEATEITE